MDIDFVGRRSKNDYSNHNSSKATQQGNHKHYALSAVGTVTNSKIVNIIYSPRKTKERSLPNKLPSLPNKRNRRTIKVKTKTLKGKSLSNIQYDTEEDIGDISFDKSYVSKQYE
ncbi:hypothetical protein BCR36DRAFT_466106 [Piromyces finnis]|uniref:Uncharacterized protein n=1 Tax=Piromyces finnis TaxID=1754191 RepID=A0A1Y1UVD4_9FUNG|nr:hypothetical protein BCR36DRAFT_466106 [Piromyces finnis]|eukprot:ORX41943.1 hypothetical protein BCR36DRAFT_466106 [Piromyces finnis]